MLKARGVKSVRALGGGWNQWVSDGNRTVAGPK
jgi:3-mercaptopyruvate sulfurtransferase SseA